MSTEPKCPKCGSIGIYTSIITNHFPHELTVRCADCKETWPIRDVGDFAQFFPVQPQPKAAAQPVAEDLARRMLTISVPTAEYLFDADPKCREYWLHNANLALEALASLSAADQMEKG